MSPPAWPRPWCLGSVAPPPTAAAGIEAVSRETGIPVSFGVQTTYTVQQAMDRSGGEMGNRGYDVTVAALTMVDALKKARGETSPTD